MNYRTLKEEIFNYFHSHLRDATLTIQNNNDARGIKSRKINQAVEHVKNQLGPVLINKYPELNKPKLYLLLQYCYTVMSFEYRNTVWPYEYMAFSRRNGELWEKFCKVAWDHSEQPHLYRIRAPLFSDVQDNFRALIMNYTNGLVTQKKIFNEISSIFQLVGEINMAEDEMFNLNNINHIIDFKSGFGSNEKGNTLRLIAVGRAYKYWDPNVNLLFLVRQNENNSYLDKIRKSNLWAVHCGDDSYSKVDELTNAGICEVRREAINFRSDLSEKFWAYLVQNKIKHYLDW